jgi:hypothetical protein
MDNIKMDLLEIGVNVVDWIGLAQDRQVYLGRHNIFIFYIGLVKRGEVTGG